MNHTTNSEEEANQKCDCKEQSSIPFLDVLCTIQDGRIKTDLYKKQTDRNQYLLPSSCHPRQTTRAIPKSLGMRILRICSDPDDMKKRLSELKTSLLARDYPESILNSALDKIKKIPRNKALKKVQRPNQTQRPVFVLPFDPRLPAVQAIQAKHWRSMSQDSYLQKVFQEPPLPAFKRNRNL